MNREQWLQYYSGMTERGIKPEKTLDLVVNCGGVLDKETIKQATVRIIDEIKTLTDTDPLEDRVTALEVWKDAGGISTMR